MTRLASQVRGSWTTAGLVRLLVPSVLLVLGAIVGASAIPFMIVGALGALSGHVDDGWTFFGLGAGLTVVAAAAVALGERVKTGPNALRPLYDDEDTVGADARGAGIYGGFVLTVFLAFWSLVLAIAAGLTGNNTAFVIALLLPAPGVLLVELSYLAGKGRRS